ncbi:MAG: alpha/beta fold hydrolase [Gammaproteobacteria bacterium]
MAGRKSRDRTDAATLRRMYLDCRFGQLHLVTAYPPSGGFDERTTLFLLHADGGSGADYRRTAAALGSDRSVYAPDLPGSGSSDGPARLGMLRSGGLVGVARARGGHLGRPTIGGESTRVGRHAVAGRPARHPSGPGGFPIGRRHSSLMYHDTHRSSFLARSEIRHGRAHATGAELPWLPLSWCNKEPAMPKSPRTFLALATVVAALASPARADGPDPKAAFERIRALAGDWAGRMEDPLAGPPVTAQYEVASGGTAVVERQNQGQSFESVTVYYLAGGRLRATLYSGAGNQPVYRLAKESTADLLLFELDGGSGFDPGRDGHVHRGEIRFVAPDRIEQRWFHYVGPREQGVTHWFLERVQQPAAPPPESVPAAPTEG